MAWQSYSRQPDGRIKFVDDAGGELTLLDSPSVADQMRQIDALTPMAPEAVPDGIAVAKSPTMTADYAQVPNQLPTQPDAPAQPVPGSNPLVPPAPLVGAPAPPTPGNALVPAAPAAPTPAAAPPPAVPTAAPGPIARAGTGGGPEDKLKAAQANLLIQQAQEELRGSPGTLVPGGTFPTGSTVQRQLGPDPGATLGREDAERRLGNVQSDLAYVEARKQQELAEMAAAEAARQAERQKRLEDLQARQQEKLGGVLGAIDAKRQEIADAKIDPNGLVNSMSTGRQALTGIMLLLGGFGKALSGGEGPSQAMQVLDDAIKTDVEMQRYAIEKKRGDLNTLGEIYRLTKEQFGDERMAQDAAYLAGLDIYKSKIQKTIAEADAAMGVETQIDENGQVIAGAPYSMRAMEVLARLDVEQARLRESLSQAANGQVAQQFQTVPDKVVGGKAPNRKKAADLLGEAAKVSGTEGQQVTYDGQKYKIGTFVEEGEGKNLRKELGDIQSLKTDIALLQKQLTDHPIGSKTYDKSKVDGLMERISSKGNVILGQGAKNNDEAARWAAILGGITTGGVDAVKDMNRWADNMARNKLDQVNAKPASGAGLSGIVLPQDVTDKASGKKPMGGGGGFVRPAPQAGRPTAPVVRASGVRATPLDRAGASLVTATTARDAKVRGKAIEVARSALADSLKANQLGQREYAVALQMADAGDIDGLLQFLGRMRGTVSLGPAPSQEDFNRQVSNQILLQELRRAGTVPQQALSTGPSVTTVTVSTGKGGGKAPAAPKPKPVSLTGERKLWPKVRRRRPGLWSTDPTISPSRCLPPRQRRSCARGNTVSLRTLPSRCSATTGVGRPLPAPKRCNGRRVLPRESAHNRMLPITSANRSSAASG